jgi:hypothetical protein
MTCEDAGDDVAAEHFFTQATGMAEKVGSQPGLISALIHAADIKARQGLKVEALADFQRALILESASNVEGQADHWFKYGKFLQQAKASPRLVFACFVKADVLVHGDKNATDYEIHDSSEIIKPELKASEALLDSATINSIKVDLNPVLQEALSLKL